MIIVVALLAAAVASFFFVRARRRARPEVARDSTPALDTFIADALEHELAGPALALRGATAEERRPLANSLRGEPDPDVVAKIEDIVKTVELEFVRYAHEVDAEVTVRVRYEDGNAGETSKRLPWNDMPEAIRAEFARSAGTRVFRTWTFPWQRASAL
jgi:hypothetical protein